ncbi:MAG: hypothetical protein ABL878_16210 [Burkholderiales bacterium]
MSIALLHLNKLLKLAALAENKLISAIRDDLRSERRKVLGLSSGGGDFHTAFWSDAKGHVIGVVDLPSQTAMRIEGNPTRKRLYPELANGFLNWLDLLRRSTNRGIGWSPESVHNRYEVPGLGVTVKVDNLLGLRIGDDQHKLVYPYFSEEPVLEDRWARMGLWLMREALPNHDIAQMEILDVLRSRSFSGDRLFLTGGEEALLARRYGEIATIWENLRVEYGV